MPVSQGNARHGDGGDTHAFDWKCEQNHIKDDINMQGRKQVNTRYQAARYHTLVGFVLYTGKLVYYNYCSLFFPLSEKAGDDCGNWFPVAIVRIVCK